PFGQELYYRAVARLFDRAWDSGTEASANAARRTAGLPAALDEFSYEAGELVDVARAFDRRDAEVVSGWRPSDRAGTRAGFVDVPMLVADRPTSAFSLRFEGRAVGLFLTAGPDTPIIEYRIDGRPWQQRDTFTKWSRGLHLPWVLMLESELGAGPHRLDVRLAGDRNPDSQGQALRIRHFLVNGPDYRSPRLTEVRIRSSLDGSDQPSQLWVPASAQATATPLLVYLHSWSGNYRQNNAAWLDQAVRRGWIYLHPDFRGVNQQPQACGSRWARQDILDAIDYVTREYQVDSQRIYLAGSSGGGHMSLLMAGYFPHRFSAVSAWVGISDLADWYRVHSPAGQRGRYAQMIVDSLGGPPGHSPEVDASYRERSPLFHLDHTGNLPLDIAAGVQDGHVGSVPIYHSLRAFNVVARAGGYPVVADAEMDQLWTDGRLQQPRDEDIAPDETYGREILLRRAAGPARVTIFDGGHEGLAHAGCEWLAKQQRPTQRNP
ncbi:MAG: alpha/beta hydrolase family protein, partial [Pirellulaceae bacterium]